MHSKDASSKIINVQKTIIFILELTTKILKDNWVTEMDYIPFFVCLFSFSIYASGKQRFIHILKYANGCLCLERISFED